MPLKHGRILTILFQVDGKRRWKRGDEKGDESIYSTRKLFEQQDRGTFDSWWVPPPDRAIIGVGRTSGEVGTPPTFLSGGSTLTWQREDGEWKVAAYEHRTD